MKEKADYEGQWKGQTTLNLKKNTGVITESLLTQLRMVSMNLLASSAFDSASKKDKHELLNMLSNIKRLDHFSVHYDAIEGTLTVKADGKIVIYLPKEKKKKKRKKNV